ncbi:hypothetical protein GGI19_002830 [Coemansia pectinata]|uniref:Pacifastin domain-containing protein n=1 Tax=Coemansia pectinata TaxID=1052879 RepID=A0A9W8LC44_9FUNG|nr:hypothetical protein GGI19_002830 [Coemansia pectinata]
MDRNDPTISEKLLGSGSEDIADQTPPHPTRQQQQRRRSPVEIVVKVIFGAICLFLLAIICTYAGSKTIFDTTSKAKVEPGEKVLVEPKIRDCRSIGCFNDFECVPVAADFACFIPPCPSTVYECQPKASLKDPEDALFSILPVNAAPSQDKEAGRMSKGGDADNFTTDRYGKPIQLTEGFYACIQQHNGQSSWRHPTEPCNTCRCNARGGVSCTKMLCKPGNRPEPGKEATTSYASRLLTTIMSQISAEAGAGVSSVTPRYTSIVIDIQQ